MSIKAGAGKAVIDLPSGFLPVEHFSHVWDSLHARVIIIEAALSVVFVSLEVTSLQDYTIREVKNQVAKHYSVAPEHIFVSVTHTFSAPHTRSAEALENGTEDLVSKNQGYLQALLSAVLQALEQAKATLQNASLVTHLAEADANVNRDVDLADGSWLGRNPQGFSSKKLPMLAVKDENEQTLAVIYSYDIQSSIVEHLDKSAVSSDLLGKASQRIEERLDGGVAFFMLGSAADQAPKTDANSLSDLDLLAQSLAESVLKALNQEGLAVSDDFWVNSRAVTVPGQVLPDMKTLKPTRSYQFLVDKERRVTVEFMFFDHLALVMLAPELASQTAETIRQNSPYPVTLVATMVNGARKYMVNQEAYDKITYEAMNSMFAKGAAEIVSQAIVKELKKSKESDSLDPKSMKLNSPTTL